MDLNYDPGYLLYCYRDDALPLAPHLPYIQLPYDAPRIERSTTPFQLAGDASQHAEIRREFIASGRLDADRDERVMRLAAYDGATMLVQECAYSDGVVSNYTIDRGGDRGLRDELTRDYGATLPPFSDARLANPIGTAIIVFHGDKTPYLPRRARRSAVFSDGRYHCTASGEAQWSDATFTDTICRELREEVGIEREHLAWIRPVAFCRELMRGGKPQLFFAAYTTLDDATLTRLRRAAIAEQIARGRQEIEDDVLVAPNIELALARHGTVEASANLAYATGVDAVSA